MPDLRENTTGHCGKPEAHEGHWWGVHFWCAGSVPEDPDSEKLDLRQREADVKALTEELARHRDPGGQEIANMLGIDHADPMTIAAEVVCSDWLRKKLHTVWAEGYAAGRAHDPEEDSPYGSRSEH